MQASITPKFNSKEIFNEWIGRDWLNFQSKVFDLGTEILSYMQEFISSRSHREGSTGNLVRSIKLYHLSGFSATEGNVSWGIGLIPEMDKQAPYWYLINFGGHTWASKTGKAVPGFFGSGNAPDSTMKGSGVGTERFTYHTGEGRFLMRPTSIIKPMNYIEASRLQLNNDLINLLNKITTTGETSNLPRIGRG